MKDFIWYFWRAFKSVLKVWVVVGLSLCAAALIAYGCWVLMNCVGVTFGVIAAIIFISLVCAVVTAVFDYKIDKEGWR